MASIMTLPRELKEAICDAALTDGSVPRIWDWQANVSEPRSGAILSPLGWINHEWRRVIVPRLFKDICLPKPEAPTESRMTRLAAKQAKALAERELLWAKRTWTAVGVHLQRLTVHLGVDLSFVGQAPHLECLTILCLPVDVEIEVGTAQDPVHILRGMTAPQLSDISLQACSDDDDPKFAAVRLSRWMPSFFESFGASIEDVFLDLDYFSGLHRTSRCTAILESLAKLPRLASVSLAYLESPFGGAWQEHLPARLRFNALTSVDLKMLTGCKPDILDVLLDRAGATLVKISMHCAQFAEAAPRDGRHMQNLRSLVIEGGLHVVSVLDRVRGSSVEELVFSLMTVASPDLVDDLDADGPDWAFYGGDSVDLPEMIADFIDADAATFFSSTCLPQLRRVRMCATHECTDIEVDQGAMLRGRSEACRWAEEVAQVLKGRSIDFKRCTQSLFPQQHASYRKLPDRTPTDWTFQQRLECDRMDAWLA